MASGWLESNTLSSPIGISSLTRGHMKSCEVDCVSFNLYPKIEPRTELSLAMSSCLTVVVNLKKIISPAAVAKTTYGKSFEVIFEKGNNERGLTL